MKKKIIISILMIYFASVQLFSQSNTTFYPVFNSNSSTLIKKYLNILAHDSLEGRGVGTKGGNLAANYISEQFSKYGLTKITSDNSYFQNIPMHGSIPLNSSDLQLISKTDTMLLNYFADYFLYRSGQQTFLPSALPIVFVGYGIDAPEFDYNDYQSVDVEGKIVVYLDGEPYSEDEDYFAGNIPTNYSYPESKRRIAISHGVAGTIQIPLSYFDNWVAIQKEFEFEDVTLAYSVSSSLSILLNPTIANKLFRGAKYSFANVVEMHSNKRIESFPLETKLKFKGVFKERDFISQNVIGMVAGRDAELKNTYLIISAHYDHLGIGTAITGDSIYNGALDNAIGVSVLLELARVFSGLEVNPKRSIVFIATTGEEEGLLGSSYYTDNPIVPLYKTIANVNIDGIAMFKDFESVVGIGTEYSTLESWLNLTAEKYKLSLQGIPPQFKSFDAFNKSDQLAFALAGIPSILLLEGTKNKYKTEDEVMEAFINYYLKTYHTPFDDLNQDIDCNAAAKHAEILFDLCYILANDNNKPEWKPGTPFINARLRTIAEKR